MAFNRDRNNSFKSTAFILLTALVVVLSAAALAVSVSITVTMLEKRDQLTGGAPDAAESLKRSGSSPAGVMDLKKASRWPLYFNGRHRDGLVYYTSESGKSLLPVDMLLDDLNADYGILNPDDAFRAVVKGKKLLLELGARGARLEDAAFELDTASITAEGHVLASPGILDGLGDFGFYGDTANEAAFAYYWPSSKNEEYSGIRLFKINGRALEISDPFGGGLYRYGGSTGLGAMDEAVYSKALDSLLVKSGGEYYLIGGKNYKKPASLNLQGAYSLSPDGEFLYRVDDTGEIFLVYDVKSGSLKRIRNHYTSVKLPNGARLTDRRLLDCRTGSGYVRLDFEGVGGEGYTTIARSGRIVAQGSSRYSPDHSRLLLHGGSDGWSLCTSDGRSAINFEGVSSAAWVDDDRLLLRTDDGLKVYDVRDGSRHPVEVPFYYAGKSADGRIFFGKGNELWQLMNGREGKIADLPWRCDYVCSASGREPVVLVSQEADGVFCISGDAAVSLGRPGLFPNIPAASAEDAGFSDNAAFSPDGDRLALLQKGEKFLELCLLGLKDLKQDRLTLDYAPEAYSDRPEVFLEWLGNDSLVIYTASRGWLVDFDGEDVCLREWTDNASIAGTFQLLK
jgi:hypothetical protein